MKNEAVETRWKLNFSTFSSLFPYTHLFLLPPLSSLLVTLTGKVFRSQKTFVLLLLECKSRLSGRKHLINCPFLAVSNQLTRSLIVSDSFTFLSSFVRPFFYSTRSRTRIRPSKIFSYCAISLFDLFGQIHVAFPPERQIPPILSRKRGA